MTSVVEAPRAVSSDSEIVGQPERVVRRVEHARGTRRAAGQGSHWKMMTKIRSGVNADPVVVGNRAAKAWAEADAGAVVIAAASDDGQAALGRAADAFRDKGKADKARAVADVAMLARAAGSLDALARRIADFPETVAPDLAVELRLELKVAQHLQATEAGGGWTALAVLHARQPLTVAPDVTHHPRAGILPGAVGWRGRACAGIRPFRRTVARFSGAGRGGGWRRLAARIRPGAGTACDHPDLVGPARGRA